jgi:hypothetical protein
METDAPLIVDADAELAFAIAFQYFEPITGRSFQVDKAGHVVEHT